MIGGSAVVRALATFAAVLAVTVPGVAAPSAAKPALSAKTTAIDANVEVDGALRRFGKLHAFLVAEGQRELKARTRTAEAEQRSNPKAFAKRRWSFERVYRLRLAVDRFVSVVRIDDSYEGDAHPGSKISTLIWDRVAEKPATLADLLVEAREGGPTLTALAKLVREALAGEKRERGIEVAGDLAKDDSLKSILPKLDKLGAPSLAPSTVRGKASGLTFHFSPQDVGAPADGSYDAFIPGQALAPYLKPELRSLFDGGRPTVHDHRA